MEEKGYNWFWCGMGLQSVENNGGVEGWRDSLAGGGVALRSDAC